MEQLNSLAIAKALALTSSGLFTGYTWALSHATVPSILYAKDESLMIRQWREQYLRGFWIARPHCAINALAWAYLAYFASAGSLARTLFIVASLTTSFGVPFALTLLRSTNGALSRRHHKLNGHGPGDQVIAMTYAFNEKGSIEIEKKTSTIDLVKSWQWYNWLRTWIMIVGFTIGTLAISL